MRGTEADTLTGIECAIGRRGADVFYGDSQANWFQGGGGKDTFTGGGGRDTYDLNSTSASAVGTARDVITDFDHLIDKIDLMGIDADTTVAGNQAFHGRQRRTHRPRRGRILHVGRQHHRPDEHGCRCRERERDPAHRDQVPDRTRLLPLRPAAGARGGRGLPP